MITQMVKKFPTFHGTQRFITVFTRAPPLVSILSEMNPVHTLLPYFPKIHCNIVLPSAPKSKNKLHLVEDQQYVLQCYNTAT